MSGNALPSEIGIETSLGRDELLRVGPSLRGSVYRSRVRPFFYRLWPIAETPLDLRHEMAEWVRQPRRAGLAPVLEAVQDYGEGVFFLRYEAGPQRSLAEALGDPDPGVRLAHVARVMGALPTWWKTLGQGLLPMPADILLSHDGAPSLLPMPNRLLPTADAVFGEPVRGLYLAPEIVRGLQGSPSESSDLYALGVVLLGCFYEIPAARAEESLWRTANGTVFDSTRLVAKLPFWLEGLMATHKAIGACRHLVEWSAEARSRTNPADLSRDLLQWSQRMEAVRAVTDLRVSGHPREALSLLKDILLEHDSFDLLLLAGRIAAEDLGHQLEAVDFFEKAMEREPGRPEPYQEQLRAIMPLVTDGIPGELLVLLGGQGTAVAKLDALLERDFRRLPAERQAEHEEGMALYLLSRGQFQDAVRFIHPRLFQGSTWAWWKLGMNLSFAEALTGQGRLGEAAEHLQQMKGKFQKARENRTIPEEEIHRHGRHLAEIEADILKRRSAGVPRRRV
jgi:hypothetical protein